MTEIIVTAKNVDAAVSLGAQKLGKSVDEVKYEVIEEGKKGILGFGAADAKVRVYLAYAETESSDMEDANEEFIVMEGEKFGVNAEVDDSTPEGAALKLLNTIISDMGIEAKAFIKGWEKEIPEGKSIPEKNIFIEIEGEGLGALIGRHGDVLDSLQYLANIAAGRKVKTGEEKKEYIKICLDIENYRAKRADTLKNLARRMADKALKYHKNMTLEPMLAYERKIIHTELQNYKGVYTYSVGSDSDRKVVIALGTAENPIKPLYSSRGYRSRRYNDNNSYTDEVDNIEAESEE
ncbi:MAG: Jag N-terminal domain-containing protein [Clostridia bacterium]|nr:Jag N-terminal domain-containing protein [Clostridia bacterium]